MTFTDPIEFDDAIKLLRDKGLLPSELDSAEAKQHLSDQLRRRAMFSSRVINADVLQWFKDAVDKIVSGQSDVSSQRVALRDLLSSLDYKPEEDTEGTIHDLSSNARLNVVLNTNVQMVRGAGQWQQGQLAGALLAFPAQELIRVAQRHVPREWIEIWDDAVNDLGDETTATDSSSGRMVALKNDPIWEQISDFGNPYPPFKFNSGMGVRPISRTEAIDLGVLDPADAPQQPQDLDLNEGVESAVSTDFASLVTQGISSFVQFVGGTLKFKNDREVIDLINAFNLEEARDAEGRWTSALASSLRVEKIKEDGETTINLYRDSKPVGSISLRHNDTSAKRSAAGLFGENGETSRITGIHVDDSLKGQGVGSWLYLKGLSEHPNGWNYNSQAYPEAHATLLDLEKRGLIELRKARETAVTEDAGMHIKRITVKGLQWLNDHPIEERAANIRFLEKLNTFNTEFWKEAA